MFTNPVNLDVKPARRVVIKGDGLDIQISKSALRAFITEGSITEANPYDDLFALSVEVQFLKYRGKVTDKVMRLFAQSHHFESGKVMLPSTASWLDDYRRELTAFPGSKHDDQVDSTTQALHYMSSNTAAEIWERLAEL